MTSSAELTPTLRSNSARERIKLVFNCVTAGNVANVRDNLVSHPVQVMPEMLRTTRSFPKTPSSTSASRAVLLLISLISCVVCFHTLQQASAPTVQQDDFALPEFPVHAEVKATGVTFSLQQELALQGSSAVEHTLLDPDRVFVLDPHGAFFAAQQESADVQESSEVRPLRFSLTTGD
jgi:hypothetical protein